MFLGKKNKILFLSDDLSSAKAIEIINNLLMTYVESVEKILPLIVGTIIKTTKKKIEYHYLDDQLFNLKGENSEELLLNEMTNLLKHNTTSEFKVLDIQKLVSSQLTVPIIFLNDSNEEQKYKGLSKYHYDINEIINYNKSFNQFTNRKLSDPDIKYLDKTVFICGMIDDEINRINLYDEKIYI